ncbi:DMT family transporter [Gottschalkiaceae bacterium SANA]|nr:DMT family transporter [Gottschalkiaceae bacterium SANA]
MDKKKRSLVADLSLLVVAIVWGTGFPVTDIAMLTIGPNQLLSIRFGFAALILGLVFRKKLKTTTAVDLKAAAISSILFWAGFTTQTIGIQYTTASKASFLTGVYVVLVPFLYWAFSKRRPDKFNVLAAFMTLGGIYLFTTSKGADILSFNNGDALVLVCAVFFASQIIAVGYYVKEKGIDPIILTVYQFAFSFVLSLSMVFVFKEFGIKQPIDLTAIVSLVFLVIFSTIIAFLAQNVAQKHTTETHAAILMSLEAVFGVIMSVILLSDPFTPQMVVGCVIIFAGIITAETKWSFLRKSATPMERSCDL